jgi:hypothetical protein
MLSFVDALKRMIADIEATGGAIIEKTFPSHQLQQQLREYATQVLHESTDSYSVWLGFLEGHLEDQVRACVVHLHKLGISNDHSIYHLLTNVIDKIVKGFRGVWKEQGHFEARLLSDLEVVWYECGDEQTFLYVTAESRWLISWNYQKSQWKTTGLGRLFMDLPPMEATIFLLSIDTLFATGEYDLHHISSSVLHRLQSLKRDDEMQVLNGLEDPQCTLLTRLGIFTLVEYGIDGEHSSADSDSRIHVTSIGQMVLNAVLSETNFYRNTILSIIRTEKVEGIFDESASKNAEIAHLMGSPDFADQIDRDQETISANKNKFDQHGGSRKFSTQKTSREQDIEEIRETLPIKIFYCYAHKDRDLRDRVDKHLGILKRLEQVVVWCDREIQAGTEWEHEIEEKLNTAHIILLLVSADFIASDYCYGMEMKKALELHRTRRAHVLPILLRPVDWQGAPFATLQMLPTGAKPIMQWEDQDEALENVAKGIRSIVNLLRSQKG